MAFPKSYAEALASRGVHGATTYLSGVFELKLDISRIRFEGRRLTRLPPQPQTPGGISEGHAVAAWVEGSRSPQVKARIGCFCLRAHLRLRAAGAHPTLRVSNPLSHREGAVLRIYRHITTLFRRHASC